MTWNRIKFNSQNIKGYRGNATVIKMPKKSPFKNHHFYHPSKLVRAEGHSGFLSSFSFTDDWEFRVYSKNGANAILLGADEMRDAFENPNYEKDDESYLVIEEPQKIDKPIETKKELMR